VRSPGGREGRVLGRHHALRERQRPLDLQEGGFAIPSIYLRDHPDVYIHTTGDRADNIEPTKIKRSAFIAAASGYYLATMPDHGASLSASSYANAYGAAGRRTGCRAAAAAGDGRGGEAANIVTQGRLREQSGCGRSRVS
jgi:hypothetical protein